MCNVRAPTRFSIGDRLPVPFAPDPGWYRAYWYPPERAASERRQRSPLAFVIAILTAATELPAEIRRVTQPCKITGE